MTNHYARPRRARGAWYDSLLTNHAAHVDALTVEDLQDLDESLQASPERHVLVSVDQPGPSRGYGLLAFTHPTAVYGRIHVIPNQSDDVYRALFSQVRVQTDLLAQGAGIEGLIPFRADHNAIADYVADAIDRLGDPYMVYVNAEHLPTDLPISAAGPISEAIAEQINATGGITIAQVEHADGSETGEPVNIEGQPLTDEEEAALAASGIQPPVLTATEEEADTQAEAARTETELTEATAETEAQESDDTPQSETSVDGSTEIPADAEAPADPWADDNTAQGDDDADEEGDDTQEETEPEARQPLADDATICPECAQEFSAPRYLKQHYKSKHPQDA